MHRHSERRTLQFCCNLPHIFREPEESAPLLTRDQNRVIMIDMSRRSGRSASNIKSNDAAISAYYDSLSDEEREEDQRWGEFAESQFPPDEGDLP